MADGARPRPEAVVRFEGGQGDAALSAKREDYASAISGRTMAQIAAANDAQWHSNRSEIEGLDLDSLPAWSGEFIEPMQPKLVEELPEGDDWIYEIKLDGYRALAIRKGNAYGSAFPPRQQPERPLSRNLCSFAAVEDGAVLDGEITALDPEGSPSFSLLQNHKTASIRWFIMRSTSSLTADAV